MRISLRALFLLTAVVAVMCLWLTTRRTIQFPSALVQFVAVSPPPVGSSLPTDDELIDRYYELLFANLNDRNVPLIKRATDPAASLRQLIRFDHRGSGSERKPILRLSAWDNSILGNHKELKEIFSIAIETLPQTRLDGRRIKIIIMPSL